ncbi:fibronectin [Bacillus thuringiensis]|nr:fibronectin [Bacillus toyonensis biovar Thuringiensis]
MPTDIHLPLKMGVSHLHIFEEGVLWRKTIKNYEEKWRDEIMLKNVE